MTSILQIPNPFPSTLHPSPNPKKAPQPSLSPFPPRAAAGDGEPPPPPDAGGADDTEFENRLSQVRIKYRSGTGKKAEQRRARKSGGGGGGGKKGKGVMLPPVPLREAVTVSGEKVELGFTPYSERINGRIAGLGLAAVVLVELGSGKGILSYHAAPVLFIQIYTIIAVSALFIKFEKERICVWPEKAESSSASSAGAAFLMNYREMHFVIVYDGLDSGVLLNSTQNISKCIFHTKSSYLHLSHSKFLNSIKNNILSLMPIDTVMTPP